MKFAKSSLHLLFAIFAGLFCQVAFPADQTGPILVVTSKSMNGHTNNENVNEFLEVQANQFAAAFQELLAKQGHKAELVDLPARPEQSPTVPLLAKMLGAPERFAYVCEVYWGVDEKGDFNINVLFLPVTYEKGSVKFGGAGEARFRERRYFLFGKGTSSKTEVADDVKSLYDDLALQSH